jgi:uncharacterized damage-inducible protein DinB
VLHIGEAEWFWMQMVVSGTSSLKKTAGSVLGRTRRSSTVCAQGYTTEFCLKEIEKIRNQTRDVLFSYNDKDLERIITFERKVRRRNTTCARSCITLIDHEAQHKGQIFMLKRLMAYILMNYQLIKNRR